MPEKLILEKKDFKGMKQLKRYSNLFKSQNCE